MTVRERSRFSWGPEVLRRLQVLGRSRLGFTSASGGRQRRCRGRAQHIKIAAHLSSRRGATRAPFLDEPTTGLHFDDIAKLLAAFRKLLPGRARLQLVIEHNLDVIKTRPTGYRSRGGGGGAASSRVVVAGTPEQVAARTRSHV